MQSRKFLNENSHGVFDFFKITLKLKLGETKINCINYITLVSNESINMLTKCLVKHIKKKKKKSIF